MEVEQYIKSLISNPKTETIKIINRLDSFKLCTLFVCVFNYLKHETKSSNDINYLKESFELYYTILDTALNNGLKPEIINKDVQDYVLMYDTHFATNFDLNKFADLFLKHNVPMADSTKVFFLEKQEKSMNYNMLSNQKQKQYLERMVKIFKTMDNNTIQDLLKQLSRDNNQHKYLLYYAHKYIKEQKIDTDDIIDWNLLVTQAHMVKIIYNPRIRK